MYDRSKTIGGSDIGAILGLNPWSSPMEVFCQKRGLSSGPSADAFPLWWGTNAEDLVRQRYAMETGHHTYAWDDTFNANPETPPLAHPDLPWAVGSPDGSWVAAELEGENVERVTRGGLEIKIIGLRQMRHWGEPGTDQIPESYLAQCCWYMMLCAACGIPYPIWHVAVVKPTLTMEIYVVERNEALETIMLDEATRFYEHNLIPGIPPEIDGSEAARTYVEQQYKRQTMGLRPATAFEAYACSELADLRKLRKSTEAEEASWVNIIKDSIGYSEGIEWPGGVVTWRANKNGTRIFRFSTTDEEET